MRQRLWRILRGHWRVFVATLGGAAAWMLLPSAVGGITRAILAWDTGVILLLALSAFLFLTERLDRMAEDAEAQEEGEWTIFWITMGAVAFSFAAVTGEFAAMKQLPSSDRALHVALVAATLLVSWLMTHTTFALRYAHEYYEVDPDGVGIAGGLEFPAERNPDYLDFLYFALVLGMTFQVSDVQITGRNLRRLATAHGVLSFLYNTIIVALTVNLAAGLL